MKIWVLISGLFICSMVNAQSDKSAYNTVGVEADILPYITGGYYGSVWVGHKHMRYRAIVTRLTTPAFILKDGFTNNKIQAYTLIADYFFNTGFKGWWAGSGVEYWKGQIQTDDRVSTARYHDVIFTAGGGYVWKFYRNFYLNPWVAGHLRVAGDREVRVGAKNYIPPFFTPEMSVKLGWHF